MELFLLPDHIVVRDDEAQRTDADGSRDLVLGGVELSTMAEFQVGQRRCLAGVSDFASADSIGPAAGKRTDLRSRAPTTMTLGGAQFDLWELPPWSVGPWTVLHLLLVKTDDLPVDDIQVSLLLLRALRFERDGDVVAPHAMGTFGGGSLVQCTAAFDGQVSGLRVSSPSG